MMKEPKCSGVCIVAAAAPLLTQTARSDALAEQDSLMKPLTMIGLSACRSKISRILKSQIAICAIFLASIFLTASARAQTMTVGPWVLTTPLPEEQRTYNDPNAAKTEAEAILREAATKDAINSVLFLRMADKIHAAELIRGEADRCSPHAPSQKGESLNGIPVTTEAYAFYFPAIPGKNQAFEEGHQIAICSTATGVRPGALIHETYHLLFGAGEEQADKSAAAAIFSARGGNQYLFTQLIWTRVSTQKTQHLLADGSSRVETLTNTQTHTGILASGYLCVHKGIENFQVSLDPKHADVIRQYCQTQRDKAQGFLLNSHRFS